MGNIKESVRLYCEMVCKGFVPTTGVYNTLIHQFAKLGKMNQARELMNEMQLRGVPPNSSTYEILICGWRILSKQAELDKVLKRQYRTEAMKLLKEMNEKGFVPGLGRSGERPIGTRLSNEIYSEDHIEDT